MKKRSDGSGYEFVAPRQAVCGEAREARATCTHVAVKRRAKKLQVVLEFDVEGDSGGVAYLWCEIPPRLSPTCRYLALARVALRREPTPSEPIDPGDLFAGREFRVQLGYRRSMGARGKGRCSDEFGARRKDHADFLRVISLIECVK